MQVKHISILVWVIILCIILLATPGGFNGKDVEGFYNYSGYYKKYCPSCGWRSRYSCSNCTNCGYCVTASGAGECVPGDSNGPYFRSDCMYWEYGDPYYYYPYSHIFPVVTIRSKYPQYRWRYSRPWRYQEKLQPAAKK
jgi:hypothetical protein